MLGWTQKYCLPHSGKKHGDDGDSFGKGANHNDDNHLFTIEHDGGEDDDGHGKGEDKEAQLGGARLSFEY